MAKNIVIRSTVRLAIRESSQGIRREVKGKEEDKSVFKHHPLPILSYLSIFPIFSAFIPRMTCIKTKRKELNIKRDMNKKKNSAEREIRAHTNDIGFWKHEVLSASPGLN
ncbi:hypothetical protein I7I50_05282 [Histoplasma capsulatum G186AR]|uniref:Uncharacterized protein n=1 Tax=Ajellomyces capsulatus TaxID=5037 RepID=A0A8H8D8L6_AJECA|nr:hypothetical protein I7I52_03541 [Histoplasma capsulatum]QSS75973.1 hypothetical protein I7I50_05282 [Histoplasma capsulatum G186AR]